MSASLLKAIKYSRGQLRHLRKYGDVEERAGAETLDQWLAELEARNAPTELPQAAGFARRDPVATEASPAPGQ